MLSIKLSDLIIFDPHLGRILHHRMPRKVKQSCYKLPLCSCSNQSLRPNHIAAGWEANPASQDVGTTRKLIAALVLHRLSLSYEEPSTNPDHKKDPSTQSWLLHI